MEPCPIRKIVRRLKVLFIITSWKWSHHKVVPPPPFFEDCFVKTPKRPKLKPIDLLDLRVIYEYFQVLLLIFYSIVVPCAGENATILKDSLGPKPSVGVRNRDKSFVEMMQLFKNDYRDPSKICCNWWYSVVVTNFKNDPETLIPLVQVVINTCYADNMQGWCWEYFFLMCVLLMTFRL